MESKKKNLIIIVVVLIAVIVTAISCLIIKSNSPRNKALALLEEELGEFGNHVELEGIFYNKELQVCVVGYYISTTEDIAVIDLEKEKVGLRSVYELLSKEVDNAVTEEDKQSAAQSALNYPYDVFIVSNLMNGNYDGWEVIDD